MNFPSRQTIAGSMFFASLVTIRYSWPVTLILIGFASLLLASKKLKNDCTLDNA